MYRDLRSTIRVVDKDKSAQTATTGASALKSSTRRMCRIAVFVGTLQAVSMTATIWTSAALEKWTQTSELWLGCHFETDTARDWEAHAFEDGESICRVETGVEGQWPCISDCHRASQKNRTQSRPISNSTFFSAASGQEWTAEVRTGSACDTDAYLFLGSWRNYTDCSCSCDDLAPRVPPPVFVMCLSYFSQSCISIVVGLSLGFRQSNVDVWRGLLFGKGKTVSTKFIAPPGAIDSRACD